MRLIVRNEVYVQAADPAVDAEYRRAALDLINKLRESLPGSLHYEWVDKVVGGIPFQYAYVGFNVWEVDPNYEDLIMYFMPTWRGEGHARGEYKDKSIVFDGKDAIAIWGLPGQEPKNKEDAIEKTEAALKYYRDTIIHELVHYYDDKRYLDGKGPKTHKAPSPEYYNSPQEFNAFFQAWADLQDKRFQMNVLDDAEPGSLLALSKFHTYFSDDPEKFVLHEVKRGPFNELNPKMRRHFIKRAYQTWKFLKDKATAGGNLSNPAASITNEEELRYWLQTVAEEVRIAVDKEWNEWADDSIMLKDLVTIMSDSEGFLDLAQDYSGTGAEWIVKGLPDKYRGDYLAAMERLRQELLAEYKAQVPKAAMVHQGSVYRQAQHTHVTEVLDYTKLLCNKDRMEAFLVSTQDGDYAAAAASFGGASLSLDVDVFPELAQAQHAYELFLENVQTDVGGKHGCAYEIVPTPTGMDEKAEKALRLLQDPTWGPSWEKSKDAYDPEAAERQEFFELLDDQLGRWKGSWNPVLVMKHRYWPRFHDQVVQEVHREHGDRVRLYRGVYGPIAREIINGGPLPMRHLTSWTASKRYAKDFVLTTPGGADMGRGQDWVTLVAQWSPDDVMFAPVTLRNAPDPNILVEAFAGEDEYVILFTDPMKKLPADEFRIVHKTRRKTV